jgi:hypothetical protein
MGLGNGPQLPGQQGALKQTAMAECTLQAMAAALHTAEQECVIDEQKVVVVICDAIWQIRTHIAVSSTTLFTGACP